MFDDHGAVNVVRRRLRSLRSTRLRRGAHDARASTTSSTVSRSRNSAPRSRSRPIPSHRAGPDLDSWGNCSGRFAAPSAPIARRFVDRADSSIAIAWVRWGDPTRETSAYPTGVHQAVRSAVTTPNGLRDRRWRQGLRSGHGSGSLRSRRCCSTPPTTARRRRWSVSTRTASASHHMTDSRGLADGGHDRHAEKPTAGRVVGQAQAFHRGGGRQRQLDALPGVFGRRVRLDR